MATIHTYVSTFCIEIQWLGIECLSLGLRFTLLALRNLTIAQLLAIKYEEFDKPMSSAFGLEKVNNDIFPSRHFTHKFIITVVECFLKLQPIHQKLHRTTSEAETNEDVNVTSVLFCKYLIWYRKPSKILHAYHLVKQLFGGYVA